MDFTSMIRSPVRNAGDYIQDGLLYCGRCHTPKQCKITVGGEAVFPACMCECEQEQYRQEQEEEQRQEKLDRINNLKRMCFCDMDMASMTFDADDGQNRKITQVARNYVDHFQEMKDKGKGLLLYGGVGTGKTFISACIANELLQDGYPCMVTNFGRIVNTLQGRFDGRQEYLDRLNRFDLLVIDDLFAERDTEFMGEVVQSVIDTRYRSRKPLIITTNLTSDELKAPADIRKRRIFSRLFEMCIPVEVKGKDRRKEKLKQDYKSCEQLLGL